MDSRRESSGNLVKIAVLWKRSQGLHRFTKPNYRHRVFILTEQALSYYAGTMDRIGALKGRVSLEFIRAVELVDHSALGLDHTLQIIYQTKKHGHVTLYVTARDKEECDDWMVTLRQVCYFNQDMLMHFHSGAYSNSKWSCCQKQCRQTLGCEPTYFLLTKSSSRYAESKRIETVNKLNRKSLIADDHCNLAISTTRLADIYHPAEDDTPLLYHKARSTSCHNLIENSTFPSNFSVTQDAQMSSLTSCYTIASGLETSSESSFNEGPGRKELFVSMDNGFNRHQVAPLHDPETPIFDTFPRKRKSFVNHQTNHQMSSPLVTATKCYIIQGRSPLGSSSREPSVEKDPFPMYQSRKASIEPRVSEMNPDIIHV